VKKGSLAGGKKKDFMPLQESFSKAHPENLLPSLLRGESPREGEKDVTYLATCLDEKGNLGLGTLPNSRGAGTE